MNCRVVVRICYKKSKLTLVSVLYRFLTLSALHVNMLNIKVNAMRAFYQYGESPNAIVSVKKCFC